MKTTRTGEFPIGFRRLGAAWQQDINGLIAFVKQEGFGCIDLTGDAVTSGRAVIAAGLRIGSIDFPDFAGLLSPDAGKRRESVALNGEHIKACAVLGAVNHFVVMAPGDAARPFAENFDYMVESYNALAPVFAENDARLVIEGYPGKGFLCCTPESYRLFFEACPSPAYGVNYDPSHLIRQGIEPIRFLHEFADRVFHVHGKDTAIDAEAQYQLGCEHPPTKAKPVGWSRNHWRYTIPGHGSFRWAEGFAILARASYQGCVSIELEDYHFNGSEAGEKAGFIHSLCFLESC